MRTRLDEKEGFWTVLISIFMYYFSFSVLPIQSLDMSWCLGVLPDSYPLFSEARLNQLGGNMNDEVAIELPAREHRTSVRNSPSTVNSKGPKFQ